MPRAIRAANGGTQSEWLAVLGATREHKLLCSIALSYPRGSVGDLGNVDYPSW